MTDDEKADQFARVTERRANRCLRARIVVCDSCRLIRARELPAWCVDEGGWSLMPHGAIHGAEDHEIYPDLTAYRSAVGGSAKGADHASTG